MSQPPIKYTTGPGKAASSGRAARTETIAVLVPAPPGPDEALLHRTAAATTLPLARIQQQWKEDVPVLVSMARSVAGARPIQAQLQTDLGLDTTLSSTGTGSSRLLGVLTTVAALIAVLVLWKSPVLAVGVAGALLVSKWIVFGVQRTTLQKSTATMHDLKDAQDRVTPRSETWTSYCNVRAELAHRKDLPELARRDLWASLAELEPALIDGSAPKTTVKQLRRALDQLATSAGQGPSTAEQADEAIRGFQRAARNAQGTATRGPGGQG